MESTGRTEDTGCLAAGASPHAPATQLAIESHDRRSRSNCGNKMQVLASTVVVAEHSLAGVTGRMLLLLVLLQQVPRVGTVVAELAFVHRH